MEKLVIPPNPNWFIPSTCYCTPDNGLIYGATSKIAYIPPKQEEDAKDPGVKILHIRKKLNCFAISPTWTENQHVAVMNGELLVMIYDFASGEALKGHKGHKAHAHRQDSYSSIIFTSSTNVLSSFNSEIIQYCLRSNQFNVFPDFTNRNPITTMKISPNHSSLVAAGTKNGLILLIDCEKMNIMGRFRGHDAEITCLDFIAIPVVKPQAPKKQIKQQPAADDMFDIYTYEKVENEFGVYREAVEDRSDDEETNQAEIQEKVHTTTSFDFLEACSSLKDTILRKDEDMDTPGKGVGKFDDNREQYGLENTRDPSPDLSMDSNPSSHTPVFTEESLTYFEDNQRMKDFIKVPKENDLVVLVSGSRENAVWMWNVNEQKPLHKIKWHPKAKSALPSIFTNVLWLNQETLLITDNNGDIIEYKIRFESKGVKDEKTTTRFNARGIISFCKFNDSSALWLSSIHRSISCLSLKTHDKSVTLDTLQIRVHCMVENPFDSHVIAIGGNDKRLCLWNTSEANHHTITLKPFMNKVQTGILALSWHPEKDNLIAFSTREGRIAVLDTTRFTNVPIILRPFTTHEIYSLAWAKLKDINAIILLACSGGKLVYYSQKDYELHHLNQFAQICSISTSIDRMILGTITGDLLICSLSEDFKILTQRNICKKYVGMICWHGQNTVAIASETGVTLIKDVDKFIATPELSNEIATTLSNRKGRVYSVRFNKAATHLVSCCMHGNIDVYSLSEEKLVASMNIETPAYSALFMPNNERIIVCGGQDSTVCAFEWEKYPSLNGGDGESNSLVKHEALDRFKNVEWATVLELTTIAKHSKRRVKKKVKENAENGNLEEVTQAINSKLNLNSTKKNHSIFTAASRELLNNSLDILETILNNDGNNQHRRENLSLNELMMGDRDDIQKFIDRELEEMPAKSIGSVIFPQLTDDLKKDISERIASKSLMDIHVAIAPAVSYDLWRKCCLAYGEQLIENDDSILAMPYLLAINDVDKCIRKLCESKHYREAWVVAKLRKERDDPIFEKIMQEWIGLYDRNGNYELAAALLCMKKEYKRAHEMLGKRQNMLPKCGEIFELLSTKLIGGGGEATTTEI